MRRESWSGKRGLTLSFCTTGTGPVSIRCVFGLFDRKELAKDHQIPIVENKPLARSLYKSTPVGNEVPAPLYAAIAEILAAVYRLNPYKYRMRGAAA